MASEAARLLDELMGRNRNAHPDDEGGAIKWEDDPVCKHFLCGYCPSELFTNTKADLGPCTLIHDEPLRKEYQESDRFEKMGYEEKWAQVLEDVVSDVDKKIKRGHQRLTMTQQDEPATNTPTGPRHDQIKQLSAKIDDLVTKAEELGGEGKVEEAQGVMKLCDQLKKERYHLENMSADTKQDQISAQAKQMEVCPVCGAFLIVGDAESRQREHLMGKQHMGYAQMRATLEDFHEKKRAKIAAHKAEMDKQREEERKRREERDKARRRSRSRDRRGSERERGSERDRGGRRGGSRERRSSRDKDRRRSRSRDRDGRRRRSRSRDRRGGGRGGGRDERDRRSRSRDRKRSRSRDRKRSRSRERRRSRDKNGSERRRSSDRNGSSKKSSRASSGDRVKDRSRDRSREKTKDEGREKSGDRLRSSSKDKAMDTGGPDGDKKADIESNGDHKAKQTDENASAGNEDSKAVDNALDDERAMTVDESSDVPAAVTAGDNN